MNTIQKKVLAQFSSQLQSHIIQFCKELSNTKYDIYILFARKAACFISVLEEIGLLTLNGKVVSERVLDYDTEWLKDKKIGLVDDTIISGTSLSTIIKRLKEIGVRDIEVNVFCVNEFWFEPKMLEDESGNSYLKKPYLTIDHAASLKFCKDIVSVFSIYPRPYSTDFPIYESFRLTEYQFNAIQNLSDWRIVDTTSKKQIESEVRCFSMSPKDSLINRFFEEIGLSLSEYAYLKLRFYSQKFTSDARSFYYCRILPLVIFDPFSIETLDKIVYGVCQAENVSNENVNKQLSSNISKLRFIQFYFATRLFRFCVNYFNGYFETNFKYSDSLREVELIFPPDLVYIISNFSYTNKIKISEEGYLFLLKPTVVENETIAFNPLIVKDILYKKFLKLYYEKELEARRLAKDKKKDCIDDPKQKKIMNRLDDGYTFNDLETSIDKFIVNKKDRKLFISNFLDNAIDSGIVVPITMDMGELTSRGYRHGEEIIWGENNDKLLGIFYNKFLDSTNSEFLKKFWFEKLLVLFLKMGLKASILEEYNYSTPPPQTTSLIGIRSYLYGFITVQYELHPSRDTKFNPVLDLETKGYWMSERLKDIGAIETTENDENYYLKTKILTDPPVPKKYENEPDDLDESLLNSAEEIAELLAIARNNKVLNASGLVLLTSCLTIQDCIASIAAEIYIYNDSVTTLLHWVRSAQSRATFSIAFLEKLRNSKTNHAWTAMNSGADKFLDFSNNEGQILVNEISEHFKKIDSFKKRSWDKYWKKEIETESAEAPDLYNLNSEIGLTIIEINIVFIYLHLLIYEILNREKLFEKLLNESVEQIQTSEQKLTACNSSLKQLIVKDNELSQVELSFENSRRVKNLEREKDIYSFQLTKIKNQVRYWSNYVGDNTARVAKYINKYQNLCSEKIPVNDIVLNVLSSSYLSLSNDKINFEIEKCVQLLNDYKKKTSKLLLDFSALVPQWGKINPIANYTCLIHVNTSEQNIGSRNQLASLVKKVIADFEQQEFSSEAVSTRSVVLLRPIKTERTIGYFIGGKGLFSIDRMTRLSGKLLAECEALKFPFHIVFYPGLEDKQIVKAFYNSQTQYYDSVHEDFYSSFLNYEDTLPNKSRALTIYDTAKKYDSDHYLGLLTRSTSRNIRVDVETIPTVPTTTQIFTYNLTKAAIITMVKIIGVVTALPVEFETMKIMLDTIDDTFTASLDDPNNYVVGTIKNKKGESIKVVVAIDKEMGTNNASSTVTHLIRSFPDTEDIIMTGIAGGVPNPSSADKHVRLGDIVVSNREGVLQFDNIKEEDDKITIRSSSSKPSSKLIGLCNLLEAGTYSNTLPWNSYIDDKAPLIRDAIRPLNSDVLKIKGIITEHPIDKNRTSNYPKVHYGPIGSSNTLLKNENKRDYLRDNYQVKAIEMEGSGIVDGTWTCSKGYLIVRGIVDYCNSDKNDEWRNYAALCAAAYAKSLIQLL